MGASSVIPMIQSISLSSVSTSLKGISFTLFNLIVHLFGEVPSSYIYGYLQEKFIEENKGIKNENVERKTMRVMMMYTFIGCFFAFLTFIFSCFKSDKKKNEKEIFKGEDIDNNINISTELSRRHKNLKSFESDQLDVVSENEENVENDFDDDNKNILNFYMFIIIIYLKTFSSEFLIYVFFI